MSNPLKLDLSKLAVAHSIKPTRLSNNKGPKKDGPFVLTQETLKAFSAVAVTFEQERADKIARGELDPKGNPVGTKYRDDGTAIAYRRPEVPDAQGRRRRRTKIAVGNIFGDLIIRRKGPRIKAARPNLQERWRCECLAPGCNRQIIVPRYYLLRKPNPKTHCGCRVATLKSKNPREYRIYMMIHQRCYNPKHTSYEHYKSRGITLYEPWNNIHKDGFKKFLEHVGSSPSQWHSLDRIHNGRGYIPGNLRWATSTEQRANQGDRIGGYTSEEIADLGLTEEEFIEKILAGEIQ